MPLPRTRQLTIAVLGAMLRQASAADAAAPTERITSLVAGADRLFALRGNTVVTFDGSGRELGRCSRFQTPPPERSAPSTGGAIDAEEALRLAGLPDDDLESAEAEDVLDDERLGPKRRRRAMPAGGIVAHALAASPAADDVWIATSDGLYRGRGRACTRLALPGREAVAVAAGADTVAVATENLLWRSDGGGSFRIAAGLVARPRALAVVDGAHTLVASDDGVVAIEPYGTTRPVLERGSDALAVCDGVALAFAGDGVWSWTGDAPAQRVGDRPPARTLTCGDGPGARFIAAGGGLYTSLDGSVWRARAGAPAASVAAAAVVGDRIWLAVDDAVVALDDLSPSQPAIAGRGAPPAPAPPLVTRPLLAPTFPWPELTVVFAGQRTPLRDGWSLVVLLAFRFGRVAASGADRRHLAAELVRRDAALAAEEFELSTATTEDPSRSARLRAIRQERKALR